MNKKRMTFFYCGLLNPSKILLCFIFCGNLIACSKSNSENNNQETSVENIILAGIEDDTKPVVYNGNKRIALQSWNAGDLGGFSPFTPEKIFLDGETIYVTCPLLEGYWKNEFWQTCSNFKEYEFNVTDIIDIYIKGSDIYASGVKNKNNVRTFYVWKNGNILFQKNGNDYLGESKILHVDDAGNVYYNYEKTLSCSNTSPLTGSCNVETGVLINNSQTLWKTFFSRGNNGNILYIHKILMFFNYNPTNSSILVSNSKHQGLAYKGKNYVWKRTNTDDSIPLIQLDNFNYDIMGACAEKDILYASGYTTTSGGSKIGIYWKNGVPNIFYNVEYVGNISVKNSDVYIAGYQPQGGTSLYWKNGAPVTQPGISNFKSYVIHIK